MRARRSSLIGGAGALALVAGLVVGLPTAAQAVAPPGSNVVINEVYGGGGNANATLLHDFVELYNSSASSVALDGWSVQYTSSAGTVYQTTALTGTLPAGSTYVVREAAGTTLPNATPVTGDATGTIAMSATAGKVALVNTTTPLGCGADCDGAAGVVDFVGFGGANDFVGTGPTTAPSNTTSVSRNAAHTNTPDNKLDFASGTPSPSACGAACIPPPPPPTERTIEAIQGTGATSPFAGDTVITKGVVTAAYPTGGFRGYYLQTQGTGGALPADHTASDGIFVFASGTYPAAATVGNYLQVTGTVSEFGGMTELTVAAADVVDLDEPFEPVTATPGTWPRTDSARELLEGMLFQPTDHYTVTDTFDTNHFGEVGLASGDTPLIQWTEVARPSTPEADAVKADNAARGVVLDDGASTNFIATSGGVLINGNLTPPYLSTTQPVRVGERTTFTAPVIVDFRNSGWNFQPTATVIGPDNTTSPVTFTNNRESLPNAGFIAETGQPDLKVASLNVLNYFTTLGENTPGCTAFRDRDGNGDTVSGGCAVRGAWDAEDLNRQQTKIVRVINSLDADVVGLSEVENSLVVDGVADEALNTLVAALNADAGHTVWAANPSASTELPPASDMDVITSAIIYKPAAVDRVGQSHALGSESTPTGAFGNAREPLAQAFAPKGGGDPFLFVINHFKSKGSAGPWPGDGDTGDGQGASNESRVRQATALNTWVNGLRADSGVDSVLLAGDFNSYTEEDPLQVLYTAGYKDVETHFGHHEYSYSFGSLSGSLDHVLMNDAALERATGTDIWNINAEESVALEYSRFNYHATNFWDASPFRASDHDPVVVGLTAGAENSTTSLEASASSQVYGTFDPATLTATVRLGRGGQPVGSVRFESENGVIGTAPVTDGVATLDLPDDLPAGAHQLTASFVPENTGAAHGSTSDPVAFTVDRATSTTHVTATTAKAKSKSGPQTYLLSMVATVALETGRDPVGTVQFRVDGQLVDSDAVSNGNADATVTVDKGSHTVEATFVPADPANHVGSTSGPLTIQAR
jgi:5'-nucleotidase